MGDMAVLEGATAVREDELMAYRESVAKVARTKGSILNRSPQHASVVIEALFKQASDHIHLLTNTLDEKVYGSSDIAGAAVSFLRDHPRGELRILTENLIDANASALLKAINAAGLSARVKISAVPDEAQKGYPFNFVVVDGRHFRFEGDRNSLEAVVQFNDPDRGATLETMFGRIEAMCK